MQLMHNNPKPAEKIMKIMNIRTETITVLLLILALLACAASARAEQPTRLATGNDYKPFSDESLPEGGMITDIVTTVFRQIGYEPEVHFLSWTRGYNLTKQAHFLGTFPYVKTPERMEEFYYSDPIYTIVTRFFVQAESDIVYNTKSDLKGLTVCKPLGYNLTDIQDFLDKDILAMQRPSTMESCFNMLRLGRVNLVPINEHVGWSVVNQNPSHAGHFKVLEKTLQEDGLYLMISRNYPDGMAIMQDFNSSLQEMKDDGRLESIIAGHLEDG